VGQNGTFHFTVNKRLTRQFADEETHGQSVNFAEWSICRQDESFTALFVQKIELNNLP